MFKQAVIYYPKDERVMKQIYKDIAMLHCVAAVKYMDMIKLNDSQKDALLKSIAKDIATKSSA